MSSKKFYILVFFLAVIVHGFGQQDPQFTQHMYTILPINPGFAGSAGICATLHFRQQWAGFVETDTNGKDKYNVAPRQMMLSLHAPVKKLHGGLGLTVYNDHYGHQSDITVKLAYSFRMNIAGGVLGVGPAVNLLSRKMETGKWIYREGDIDPILVSEMGESEMYYGVSFGAYYEMQQKWYAGISATQIYTYGGKNVNQQAAPHLYLLGGYTFVLDANPNWELKPCALIKTDFKTPPQADLTLMAEWSNMFGVGITYRIIDAVAILGTAKPFINSSTPPLRGLEAVVSYDINTSQMMRHSRSWGGPEICLKYCFKIVPIIPISAYRNTRQLGNLPIDYRR